MFDISVKLDNKDVIPGTNITGTLSVSPKPCTKTPPAVHHIRLELIGTAGTRIQKSEEIIIKGFSSYKCPKHNRNRKFDERHRLFYDAKTFKAEPYTSKFPFRFFFSPLAFCGDVQNDYKGSTNWNLNMEEKQYGPPSEHSRDFVVDDLHDYHSPMPPTFRCVGEKERKSYGEVSYYFWVSVVGGEGQRLQEYKQHVTVSIPELYSEDDVEWLGTQQVCVARYEKVLRVKPPQPSQPAQRHTPHQTSFWGKLSLRKGVKSIRYEERVDFQKTHMEEAEAKCNRVFVVAIQKPVVLKPGEQYKLRYFLMSDAVDDYVDYQEHSNGRDKLFIDSSSVMLNRRTEIFCGDEERTINETPAKVGASCFSTEIDLSRMIPTPEVDEPLYDRFHYPYAMEITRHFEDIVMPDNLGPEFQICNVIRRNELVVTLNFKDGSSLERRLEQGEEWDEVEDLHRGTYVPVTMAQGIFERE